MHIAKIFLLYPAILSQLIVFLEGLKNAYVTIVVFTLMSRCHQDAEEMLKIAISISETLENKVSSKWVSWVISNILGCLKVML